MVRLALVVVVACSTSSPPPVTPPPPPVTAVAPPPQPEPPGWRRVDLTRQSEPLAATIAVPPDATVTADHHTALDADGLPLAAPIAKIRISGGELEIGIDAEREPMTPDTEAASHHDFALAAEAHRPTGEWARARRWPNHPDSCFVHGASPRARLACRTWDMAMTCDAARVLADVCVALEPKGARLPLREDLSLVFRRITDPAARRAMADVIRAIAREDVPAFERRVAPAGLAIGKRVVAPAELHRRLAATTLAALTDADCRHGCEWGDNVVNNDKPDVAWFTPHDQVSYGIMHVLRVARQPDGAWRLDKLDTFDLGEDR